MQAPDISVALSSFAMLCLSQEECPGWEDMQPEETANQELAETIQKSVEKAGIAMSPD